MTARATSRKWPKRLVIIGFIVILLLCLAVLTAHLALRSTWGHNYVEAKIEAMAPAGQSIEITGLQGDLLGRFEVDSVAISDADGAWMTARDVDMTWSPWSLLGKELVIDTLSVASTDVTRRPILVASDEPLNLPFESFTLDALSLPRVALAEAVIGRDVTLSATGRASHSREGGQLILDAATLNSDIRDSADIDLKWSPEFLLTGDAEIIGEAGGLISNLLNLGTQETLRMDVKTQGTQENLTTTISGHAGERAFVTGEIRKRGDSAEISAELSPEVLPKFESFANILGGDVTLDASLDKLSRDADIDARIRAPKLDIDVTAATSNKGYVFSNLTLLARTPLESFPDAPASVETVRLTGSGTYEDSIGFSGRVLATGVAYDDYNLKSVSGPVSLALEDAVLTFDTDLTGEIAPDEALSKWMRGKLKLLAKGRYNFAEKFISLSQSDIRLPGLNVAAKGQASLTDNTADLSGRFDFKKGVLIDSLPASLSGTFSTKTVGKKIALDVKGKARDLDALPTPLPQLIEDEVSFNAKTIVENGRGITVNAFSATAKELSLRGNGQYNFDKTLRANVSYETGPFEIGTTEVSALDGTGKVAGALWALRFEAAGDFPYLTVSKQTISNVNFKADGRQDNGGINANIDVTGESESGPVSIVAEAAYAQGRWQLSNTQANLGDLSLKGNLSGQGGDLAQLSGAFSVTGDPSRFLPAKAVNFDVNLSDSVVDVDGTLEGINIGPLTDAGLTLSAQGPREAVTFEAKLDGKTTITQINRDLALTAKGSADMRFPLASVTTDLSGNLGQYELATTSPLTVSHTATGWRGDGALNLFDGAVSFTLNDQPQSLKLKGENLKLADVMILMGRAGLEGRTGFDAELRKAGSGFDGEFAGNLTGVRQPGSDAAVLDAALTGQILNNQLTLRAESTSGALSGQATLGGTVSTQVLPPFLGWPPATPLRGEAKAAGDIGSLAELFLPPETNVGGNLNLDMRYSLPLEARGMTGTMSMTGGTFEQGAIGLILKEMNFASVFEGTTISVSRFSARDDKGGTLTGDGQMDIGFANGSAINLAANNLHVFTRREGFAVLSGDLKLNHDGDKLALKGGLIVDDASVSIDKFPRAGRPTLDVNFSQAEEDAEKPARTATELDVKITSPSRIKLRGRGVNASMSLDAQVTGAFNDPILSGEAEVTRGRFDFLGKRFALNESKVIFNDAIMESRLDVAAIRETSDLTATVKVIGTISRPEITLESTPQLPEDEVISRILFGRSASQLTTIETARLAAALAQLSGGGGFDLLGGLENALGLDTLDFGQSETGQTQLTTGKYLSDNVYVEVRGSAEGTPGLAVEWTPRKNIAIEAETAPGETQRVSVQWQKDFD